VSRRKIIVDKELLVAAINEVECEGPVADGITELYKRTAALYNQFDNCPEPIAFSVVPLRIKEWGLTVKTIPVRVVKRRTKAEIKAAGNVWGKVKADTPDKYKKLVDRAAKGSKIAALKLKCLECSCYQTREVRECTVDGCPLWPIRPFRKVEE
jgi:hypothetical protein